MTENVNDVTILDRGFLHGDFVAATSDPIGQVGFVVDVNISVDLLLKWKNSRCIFSPLRIREECYVPSGKLWG